MASRHHLTIAVLLIIVLSLAAADENPRLDGAKTSQAMSFNDVLFSNSLPIGLFPRGISDFSIDIATGQFHLSLQTPSPCDAVFETRLRYDRDITGSVSYGRIANLTGVSAQELFLWLPVKGIQVDIPSSGLIYFDVEVVSKQFSLSLFETPKDCHFMEDLDVVGGKSDVVLLDGDHERISESPSEKYMMKHLIDQEKRAVS